MPKPDFGIWVLYMSTTTLMEQARVGFLKNGFIKFLASDDPKLKSDVFGASVYLNLMAFLITTAGCLGLALWIGPVVWGTAELKPMFLWYIPYSLLLTFYLQFKMIEQAHMDFRGSFLTAFFRRIFFILAIISLIIFQLEVSLMNLVYLNLVSIVIGVAAAYFLARKKMIISFRYNREWVAKLSGFGVYTFGTNLGATILRNIDQFMLGALPDKIFLAYYNTAVRITNLIEIPTNAMSSIVYPKSVRMAAAGEGGIREMYEKSVAIIFLFVLPIVVAVLLFPTFFLWIVAGKEYYDAVNFLQVTILFALFVPFMRQAGTVLDSLGHPKINFYLTLFSAGLNVLSNLIFIHFYGPIGAAYGTLVSYSVIIIVNQYFLNKYLGVQTHMVLVYLISYVRRGLTMVFGIMNKK